MSSPRFEVVAPFQPAGDQPKAIRELTAGLIAGRQVSDPARRDRLGQDDDAGARHRQLSASQRWCSRTTRPSRRSCTASSGSSCPGTRWSTSSPTTTTTSPRRTSPRPTCTSRRTPRSTRTSRALRLRATSSLMEREDVVIVATVSAIYGLGDPVEYRKLMVTVRQGEQRGRDAILADLVRDSVLAERRVLRAGHLPGAGRYDRDLPGLRRAGHPDRALGRRGRADQQDQSADRRHHRPARPVRHLSGQALRHPASHDRAGGASHPRGAGGAAARSCKARASCSRRSGSNRAPTSTSRCCWRSGTCAGIENYSRHLSGRLPGERPACLLRLLPARLPGRGGRVARDACRRSAACSTATAPAS